VVLAQLAKAGVLPVRAPLGAPSIQCGAWLVFEPILAVHQLKSRYAGWYGLDYSKYARLHARGFALSIAALCAQVDAGLRLLTALDQKPLLPARSMKPCRNTKRSWPTPKR